MKKRLYYTVEKELQSVGDIEETTGNKTVTVYKIVDNEPKNLQVLECSIEDNSKDEIENWIEVANLGQPKDFELILL